MAAAISPKTNRLRWRAAALLLGLFGCLVAYQLLFADRVRFLPSVDLLAELRGASLADDALPTVGPDWVQWRGPARLGFTRQLGLPTAWPPRGPAVLWRIDGGDGYSSFAVRDGRAFTLLTQPDGREAVLCLDARTGQERWRRAYDPEATFDYGGPRATPAVEDDSLYTVSSAGRLTCLDAAVGNVRWEADFRKELKVVPPKWGHACSPLVEGDLVFVSPGGPGSGLAAFDRLTGRLLWASQDDPAGYSSPVAITAGGTRQIVFLTARRLVGVAPADGRVLWEFPWATPFDVNAATPLPFEAEREGKGLNYVFISSGYGKGSALVRVAAEKGRFRADAVYETNELCCHFASPVRRGNFLYALDEKRQLTCLDLLTGDVRWRQTGFQKGTLIRVDDYLLVLGENGRLVLADADPACYAERARCQPLRGRCWTLPALADGRLYLRDQKQILCLDLGRKGGDEPASTP